MTELSIRQTIALLVQAFTRDGSEVFQRRLGRAGFTAVIEVLATVVEHLATSHRFYRGGFLDTESPAANLLLASLTSFPPVLALRLANEDVLTRMSTEAVETLESAEPDRKKYDHWDIRWAECLIAFLTHKKHKFLRPKDNSELVALPEEDLRIAMSGDWGTGLNTSTEIARLMKVRLPHLTIHLGDVYYAGTEHEENTHFLKHWQAGSLGSFALNSNHEMYSKGQGYFEVLLKNASFRMQAASYFCLSNRKWCIIGLDSAFFGKSPLYMAGALGKDQRAWFIRRLKESKGKKVIVLSHHNPLELNGSEDQPFLAEVTTAEPNVDFRWYWGHAHNAVRFKPQKRGGSSSFVGRCVGHGGIPYSPWAGALPNHVEWAETRSANKEKRGRNGFVMLVLEAGGKGTETFVDEYGMDTPAGSEVF